MSSFWTNRRVLVTGGAGFLGRRIVARLRSRGCTDVFVPRSAEYDLVRLPDVERVLADSRPEVVVHAAARVGGIGANRDQPARLFFDNLMMGAQIMEASRAVGVAKFVGIGTVCAYPKHAAVPFREDDIWNGYPEETNAPYGLAKKMLLVQARAYREQYGFSAITLLPANLYGPGDNFDLHTSHVIPAIVRKCFEARQKGERQITLWGDGTPTREFLHVDDAAEGIVLAAERYDDVRPINLGTGAEISIRDLADRIVRLVPFEGQVVWDASQPGGQPRRSLDTSRAERILGFRARIPLEEGLGQTIEWYRKTQTAAAR